MRALGANPNRSRELTDDLWKITSSRKRLKPFKYIHQQIIYNLELSAIKEINTGLIARPLELPSGNIRQKQLQSHISHLYAI